MAESEHVLNVVSVPSIFGDLFPKDWVKKIDEERRSILTPEAIEKLHEAEAEWGRRLVGISGPVALYPGEGSGEGEEGDTEGSNDDSDDNDDGTGGKTPEQIEVDKAYAKLREAEAREAAAVAEVTKLKRTGMGEAEKAAAERDDARAETVALQAKLDAIDKDKAVMAIATTMKFKNPGGAKRFITTQTDEKSIREELKAVLKEFPEMANDGAPAPPVGDTNTDTAKSGNARMNASLRAAAGRG